MNAIQQRKQLGDDWRNANAAAARSHVVIQNGSRYADAERDARGQTMTEIERINAEIAEMDAANSGDAEYRRIFLD